jgi:hypothetical protein
VKNNHPVKGPGHPFWDGCFAYSLPDSIDSVAKTRKVFNRHGVLRELTRSWASEGIQDKVNAIGDEAVVETQKGMVGITPITFPLQFQFSTATNNSHQIVASSSYASEERIYFPSMSCAEVEG